MLALPFYIPRAEMPQVDDLPKLLDWLREHDVTSHCLPAANPTFFRNHQRVAIDPNRAKLIPPSALKAPILSAKDGFIIDGNHRWALALESHQLISVWIVDLWFGSAMTLLAKCPLIRHESGEQ